MEEATDDESFGEVNETNQADHTQEFSDGGYGWVVTFASFMCHFIADGIAFTFGVIYSDLLAAFSASKSATSWVGSVFVGVPLLCGPIAGLLVNKYGCRVTTICGAIITSLGMLLSSFAVSLEMLCVTYGVVAGFGLALVYVPASVIPSFWFEKRRALATGIAVSGSGLGTFAIAPLMEYLIEEYGWRGTLLILSGVTLNFMVFGALFREAPTHTRPGKNIYPVDQGSVPATNDLSSQGSCQPFKSLKTDQRSASCASIEGDPLSNTPLHKKHHSTNTVICGQLDSLVELHPNSAALFKCGNRSEEILENSVLHSNRSLIPLSRHDFASMLNLATRQRTISTSCPELSLGSSKSEESLSAQQMLTTKLAKKFRKLAIEMFDVRLFAVPVYVIFFISNFMLAYAYDLPYIYLPDYANERNIGNSSFLIAIVGIVNAVGQVLYGYLGDRKSINTVILYGCSILLCGVLVSIIPLLHSYAGLATASALFGLFISANFSLETVVLVKILSLRQLTKAYGLLMFGQGVASLIGPPIGGLLWDVTGTYTYTFLFTGISIALSGLLALIIAYVRKNNRSRNVSECTNVS